MSRPLVAALVGVFSLAACAADEDRSDAAEMAPETTSAPSSGAPAVETGPADTAAQARAREVIEGLIPQVPVDRVATAPLPGFQEVMVAGQVLYVSDDGRYLIQGSVLDVEARRDLTEASRAVVRQEVLAAMDPEQRIVFAPENPVHTVTVFTDIECGYCRQLHREMDQYHAQGIAVEYLFFPRSGLDGSAYSEAVSVWCAEDRHAAMTAAKAGETIPERSCDNPVAEDYAAGQRIGIEGTPAIFNEQGRQIGGYLPPAQMRERLDALAEVVASTP